jgi:hypothetical protein
MAKKEDKQQPPDMVQIAQLDANDIYQGVQEIDKSMLTDAHVLLPNGCDLPPGTHRWNRDHRTFVSIDPDEEAEKPAPHAMRAMAIFIIAMHHNGMPLPSETQKWLDFYCTSMDFMGELSQEEMQMVKEFQSRKVKP